MAHHLLPAHDTGQAIGHDLMSFRKGGFVMRDLVLWIIVLALAGVLGAPLRAQETGEDQKSSSPGESHPEALKEPDVKLSPHPAPTVQPPV